MATWRLVDIKPELKKDYFVIVLHPHSNEKGLEVGTFYKEGWWTKTGIVIYWLDELAMPGECDSCDEQGYIGDHACDCEKGQKLRMSGEKSIKAHVLDCPHCHNASMHPCESIKNVNSIDSTPLKSENDLICEYCKNLPLYSRIEINNLQGSYVKPGMHIPCPRCKKLIHPDPKII